MTANTQKFILPHTEMWERCTSALKSAAPVQSVKELWDTFYVFFPASRKQRLPDVALSGLTGALQVVAEVTPSFDFFNVVLPHLRQSALNMPTLFPDGCVDILAQNESKCVVFTPEQAHCLLSLSFLGLLPSSCSQSKLVGEMDWLPVLGTTNLVAVHRVACQLSYFNTIATQQGFERRPPGNIVVQRYAVDGSQLPNFVEADQTFEPEDVTFSTTTFIEDANGCDAHVDFANMQLHIGTIIPSCTQEEVLFSIRPDLFLTLMCVETLLPYEAVVVRGCPRYCKYTGYQMSFRWAGTHSEGVTPSAVVPDIIAIDSVVNKGGNNQFQQNMRDLRKCYGGFGVWDEPDNLSSLARFHGKPYKRISTGKWGCGVFGGDNTLKFLQQLIVAVACPHRKRLQYCCFGSDELAASLEALFAAICHKSMQVRDVHRAIQDFAMSGRRDFEFSTWITDYVKQFSPAS